MKRPHHRILAAGAAALLAFASLTATPTASQAATATDFASGFSSTQGTNGWRYSQRTGGANSNTITPMTYETSTKTWVGTRGSRIGAGKLTPGDGSDAVLTYDVTVKGWYKVSGWVMGTTVGGDGTLVKTVTGTNTNTIDWAAGQLWPELEQGSASHYNDTGYAIVRKDTDRDSVPGIYENTVVELEAGTRLYFIANQNVNNIGDTVYWNPSVTPTTLPFTINKRGLVVSQSYVDGSLAFVNRGNGIYDTFNSVGSTPQGNTHHHWRSTVNPTLSITAMPNLPTITNTDGYPNPWLNYIENAHKISDSGTPSNPDDDVILAFMHLENYAEWGGNTDKVAYKLGLAISKDGGQTFRQVGDILGNNLDQAGIKTNPPVGGANIQGVPYYIGTDGYIYVYYSESLPIDNSVRKYGRMTLSVARASYQSVVDAVLKDDKATLKTLFKKSFNGQWNEPAIDARTWSDFKISGGKAQSLEDSDRGAHTMIAYNNNIDKSVYVNTSNRGFSLKLSRDPANWQVPSYIFDKGSFMFYGSLLGTETDPYLLGKTFNVFYGQINAGYRQATFDLDTVAASATDKDALRDLLRVANAVPQGAATAATWSAFTSARSAGTTTAGDAAATQADINAAINTIGLKLAPVLDAATAPTRSNDSAATYGAGWSNSANRGVGDFNNDVQHAAADGATFTFTFNGTGVDYISEKNSDQGLVDIYLDGTLVATVDGSNPTRLTQQTLFSARNLSSGSHTLKGVKKSGQFILVDAFDVVTTVDTVAPNTATRSNQTSATYTGAWANSANRSYGDHNADVQYSFTNGDAFTFTFVGTGVSYISEKNSDQGLVDMYLDGTLVATVDGSNPTRLAQQTLYSVKGLTLGSHTLKGVKKSGQYILVDAFDVFN